MSSGAGEADCGHRDSGVAGGSFSISYPGGGWKIAGSGSLWVNFTSSSVLLPFTRLLRTSRTSRPVKPGVIATHLSSVSTSGAEFPIAPAGVVVVVRWPRASSPKIVTSPKSSCACTGFRQHKFYSREGLLLLCPHPRPHCLNLFMRCSCRASHRGLRFGWLSWNRRGRGSWRGPCTGACR